MDIFKNAVTGFIALALSGCASTTVYEEQFSSIAVSNDQNKIIVLGSQYDYVFDMPGHLEKSLQSGFVNNLTCTINRVAFISRGGKTYGSVRLDLTSDATESEIREAKAMGYSQEGELIFYWAEMHGMRVQSADMSDTKLIELNKDFKFTVRDSELADTQLHMMSPVILIGGTAAAISMFPATALFAAAGSGLRN